MSPRLRIALAVAVVALFSLLSATLFTVGETQQALIVRLGAPQGVIVDPGLKWKLPLLDTVLYYDTRLLTLEPPTEQVILGDQKRIEVQTYTRYRITDPLRFYQSLRTPEQAASQLNQLVSSSLRRELGPVTLRSLLSDERPRIVEQIQREVAEKARALGV